MYPNMPRWLPTRGKSEVGFLWNLEGRWTNVPRVRRLTSPSENLLKLSSDVDLQLRRKKKKIQELGNRRFCCPFLKPLSDPPNHHPRRSLFPRPSCPQISLRFSLFVSVAMAVVSESTKRIEVSEPKDPSPSGLAADAASESSLIARSSFSADTPDRNDSSNSSPNPYKDAEAQVPDIFHFQIYIYLCICTF